MSRSCALCGARFSLYTEKWLGEFRAVYIESLNWEDVQLSGVGTFSDPEPWAPKYAEDRYDDRKLDRNDGMEICIHIVSLDLVLNPMTGFEPISFWGFGFHSACWDLLTTLFRPDPTDLFYLCLSMPVMDAGIIDWGHEYGGALSRKHTYRGQRFSRSTSDVFSHSNSDVFKCDPFNTAVVTQRFFRFSAIMGSSQADFRSNSANYKTEGDIFDRLPPELLQDIVIKLQSVDVVNLRKSSPAFAKLHLPEAFWASRFQRGHEYHHIFESSQSRPSSWRALYLALRFFASDIPSLNNRKRVWDLALRLQALLAQVSGFPCHGQPLKSHYELDGQADTHSWHTASRAGEMPEIDLSEGPRPLRIRALHFETGIKVQDLWVSFVSINEATFVSGFRFVRLDGSTTCLGYIHSDAEVRVKFSDNRHEQPYSISGWHLAIDPSGFRAIAAVTEDGTTSIWTGQADDSPKWRLAGPNEGISVVKAEFDALKLVSLSRDVSPDTSFDKGLLWRNSFMFGGPHGELLCQLVEVVVHIFDTDVLLGFEFIYKDPSKNQAVGLLGPYTNSIRTKQDPSDETFKYSMAIDGPAGERIQEVKFDSFLSKVDGMKIRTNCDREMKFPPLESIKEEDLVSIEPSGSVIIGFYFNHGPSVQRLGLMSINIDEDSKPEES
ncbi:hypothetical protein NM208_g9861 [Fusarium decemcellulare]|uniref:Uncharacterized protein n=1 Tax=Fusarium decemcellulare TaxID=57161 RepID=A0ACC1S094_9HYPO|nr:hypothetical protein NM208_g9861 [Fusarium decemcellulare]